MKRKPDFLRADPRSLIRLWSIRLSFRWLLQLQNMYVYFQAPFNSQSNSLIRIKLTTIFLGSAIKKGIKIKWIKNIAQPAMYFLNFHQDFPLVVIKLSAKPSEKNLKLLDFSQVDKALGVLIKNKESNRQMKRVSYACISREFNDSLSSQITKNREKVRASSQILTQIAIPLATRDHSNAGREKMGETLSLTRLFNARPLISPKTGQSRPPSTIQTR